MMNRSHPALEAHVSYGTQSYSVHVSVPVAVLSGILFLSGIGALIFETLWLRLSGLAFGNSTWAVATASFLCLAGGARRSAWLHNRFWSSGAGRIVAARVANALELSAHASWAAVRRVFPNSTYADNCDGPDAPGVDRRSNVAANQFWARDWFSVWREHVRRGGWRCTRRRLSHRGVWPSRHEFGCRLGGLHRRNNRLVSGENWRRYERANSQANVSATLRCKVSAAVASASR